MVDKYMNEKNLAQVENYVLEKVRKPIMNLVKSQANRQCKAMDAVEEMENMKQELATRQQLGETNRKKAKPHLASDCHELFLNGERENGIYIISPDGEKAFNVYCDMKEGGWTLLQRRVNGSESFNRTWQEYVDGFGDLNGEFWLGLDKIHILTVNHRKVMFDFQLMSDKLVYIWYWYFSVGNATTDYILHISGYVSGLRERTFGYNNGQKFATYDRDNEHNCGKRRYGGWWYDNCTWLNINGQYNLTNSETGMTKHCCNKYCCKTYRNLKKTSMKIL